MLIRKQPTVAALRQRARDHHRVTVIPKPPMTHPESQTEEISLTSRLRGARFRGNQPKGVAMTDKQNIELADELATMLDRLDNLSVDNEEAQEAIENAARHLSVAVSHLDENAMV